MRAPGPAQSWDWEHNGLCTSRCIDEVDQLLEHLLGLVAVGFEELGEAADSATKPPPWMYTTTGSLLPAPAAGGR
ncbi:hypothetical protein U9M48_023059 [Paspalum notatum var. saurae]|uniref:Uncharacterized protein n=1 Tax=Paspalum notatum var. saurae TaxID=547442 RepID=A0AAQ3WVS2_PASNO